MQQLCSKNVVKIRPQEKGRGIKLELSKKTYDNCQKLSIYHHAKRLSIFKAFGIRNKKNSGIKNYQIFFYNLPQNYFLVFCSSKMTCFYQPETFEMQPQQTNKIEFVPSLSLFIPPRRVLIIQSESNIYNVEI